MAPRQPKPKPEDTSTTPSPLKPKTKSDKPKAEKAAKVTKPKVAKEDKAEKVPKAEKEKAIKKDKEKTSGIEAPVKEKVKAVNGDEAVELIAKYLKEQNRPYSATEVSANLHGKVTKTVADKLMKEMGEKGQIMAKATNGDKKGSQWVFWAIQDPADSASPEELSAMETAIITLRETLPALKTTLKLSTAKLHTLKSAPTTSELALMVEALQRDNAEKKTKLEGFQSGSVKMVTKEEMENVEKEYKYWGKKRVARKNAFLCLEGNLLEGMTREEIWERVGVEDDTYGS